METTTTTTPIITNNMCLNSLTLNIKPQNNILDGISLKEPFEKNILLQLIHSDLLKTKFNNKYAELIHHTEKTQLEKYLEKETNGTAFITYKRRKNNPFGRCDPERALGLYQLRREIRHTLIESWGVDIDIVNCHPVLLLQLAEANNIKCGVLKSYIENREEYMKELMNAYGCDREAAKNFFIITIYGAAFHTWIADKEIDFDKCADFVKGEQNGDKVIKELNCMTQFRNDIDIIQKAIFKNNEEITQLAHEIKKEKGKTKYNIIGTVCSYVLQEWEVRILECVFKYCFDKKYIRNDVCVLCADGLILERRYFKPKLLKEIENEVSNKIGFKLNFVEKDIDKSYSKDLIKHFDFKLEEKGTSDSYMAECFSILYGDKFVKNNGINYFYNDHYWEIMDKKNSILHNFIDTIFYDYIKKDIYKKYNALLNLIKEFYISKKIEITEDFENNIKNEFDMFVKILTKKIKPPKVENEQPNFIPNKKDETEITITENNNKSKKKSKKVLEAEEKARIEAELEKAKIEAAKTDEEKAADKKIAEEKKQKLLDENKLINEKNENIMLAHLLKIQFEGEINRFKEDIFNKMYILELTEKGVEKSIKTIIFRKNIVEDVLNKIMRNYVVFNNDPLLFAFNNKIYDLEHDIFIPSRYDQYISYTCGYNYSNYYPTTRINELKQLIITIFPNEKIRDYYMFILATGLCGIQLEYLFIATGIGGNGKSLINALAMKTFGAYAYKLGSAVLMNPIKGGANPEIANLDKKRFVIVQEPQGTVCSSTSKELTGDGVINGRVCFSNECAVILVLTLVVECNVIPKIDEVGAAVERRLKAVPFQVQFMNAYDYEQNEDKTNTGIINTFYKTNDFKDDTKQALFEILRDYFKKFRENNYNMPELPTECKALTRDYLATSDNIYDWFLTIYEKAPEGGDEIVYIDDVYKQFINSNVWELMTKKDKLKYNKKYFVDNIEKNIFLKRFYKQRNSYYKGKQQFKPFIIGHRIIGSDEDCEETDNNSDITGETEVI